MLRERKSNVSMACRVCVHKDQGKGTRKGGQGYVTVGYLRITRGNHRLNISQLGLTPGHLIVNLGLVKITLWSI